MSVRVIIPPEPIVVPTDIGAPANDDAVIAMIAAATAEIDGPNGWLGRSLGEQTLELCLSCWASQQIALPFPPSISVESVKYFNEAGAESTVDDTDWECADGYVWFRKGWVSPALDTNRPEPIRIRYVAGYNGTAVKDSGTGVVPPQVKQAIILSVQHMRSLSKDDLFVRAEEIDGVGRTEFTVSEQAGNIIRQASERLLAGLRVYA